jgi:hypothetical protein
VRLFLFSLDNAMSQPLHLSSPVEFRLPLQEVLRTEEDKRLIRGTCFTSPEVESDDWVLPYEVLKEMAPDYEGAIRSMHQPIAAGVAVETIFDDKAKTCDIVAEIVDDHEWKKCLKRVYKYFSVGVKPSLYTLRADGKKIIRKGRWSETSLCDIGKDRGAKLQIARRDTADQEYDAREISEVEGERLGEELERKFDPRQPRDDHGKWSDGAGGISAGHAVAVMKHEGITDSKHHAAVRKAIESGKHKTREDVLKHIDAIHEKNGTKPPQAGSTPKAGKPVTPDAAYDTAEERLKSPLLASGIFHASKLGLIKDSETLNKVLNHAEANLPDKKNPYRDKSGDKQVLNNALKATVGASLKSDYSKTSNVPAIVADYAQSAKSGYAKGKATGEKVEGASRAEAGSTPEAEIARYDDNQPRDDEGKWTIIRGHRVSTTGASVDESHIHEAVEKYNLGEGGRKKLLAAHQAGKLQNDHHLYRAIARATDNHPHHDSSKIAPWHWDEAITAHAAGGSHEGKRHWQHQGDFAGMTDTEVSGHLHKKLSEAPAIGHGELQKGQRVIHNNHLYEVTGTINRKNKDGTPGKRTVKARAVDPHTLQMEGGTHLLPAHENGSLLGGHAPATYRVPTAQVLAFAHEHRRRVSKKQKLQHAEGVDAEGVDAEGVDAEGVESQGESPMERSAENISEDENTQDENTQGENTQGENTPDENAERENAEHENAEHENAEHENAEHENAERTLTTPEVPVRENLEGNTPLALQDAIEDLSAALATADAADEGKIRAALAAAWDVLNRSEVEPLIPSNTTEELSVVRGEAVTLRADLEHATGEATRLEEQARALRGELAGEQEKVERLEAETQTLRGEAQTLRTEAETLKSQIETLRAQKVERSEAVQFGGVAAQAQAATRDFAANATLGGQSDAGARRKALADEKTTLQEKAKSANSIQRGQIAVRIASIDAELNRLAN